MLYVLSNNGTIQNIYATENSEFYFLCSKLNANFKKASITGKKVILISTN